MPIDAPWYWPAPKSGCTPTLGPIKLMIAVELGSTSALEMSWFQRLSLGKGRNPFKLAPCPVEMTLQGVFCWLPPPPLPPPPLPPDCWVPTVPPQPVSTRDGATSSKPATDWNRLLLIEVLIQLSWRNVPNGKVMRS